MALTAFPDHSVGDIRPLFGSACLNLIAALVELAAGELAAIHRKLAQADHADARFATDDEHGRSARSARP
jgi:hypothetical protein